MRRTRIIFVMFVVAAAAGVLAPSALRAAPGGPMTASNGTFTGTDGDDLLVISREGDVLAHNRFAAGDAGFASASDFDSIVAGAQTKPASASIGFVGGLGDDKVQFVGDIPEAGVSTMNFGAGNDTLDFSTLTRPAFMNAPTTPTAEGATDPTLERINGSPFDDRLLGSSAPGAVGITIHAGAGNDFLRGTAANDTLDGGTGVSEIDGRAGADNLVVTGAPPAQPAPPINGGDGSDALLYTATSGDDEFEISPSHQGLFVRDNANNHGFNAQVESAVVSLAGGNDLVLVTPPHVTLVVSGGAGDDDVFVNARETTLQQSSEHDDVLDLRLANPIDGLVDIVAISDDVESRRVLNETVLATAPGPGGGPHVRTFRADGSPLASFFAYGQNFHGGVSVALGDLDGDLDDEIVTGPGAGGGPHVRVFRSDGTDAAVSFMAYAPNFTGGVNVGTIDINGDNIDEIVTVPATGGGPHVRVWTSTGELIAEWMASGFGNTGLQIARGTRVNNSCCENLLISNTSGAPTRTKVFATNGGPGVASNELSPYTDAFGGGAAVSGGVLVRTEAETLKLRDLMVTGAGPTGGPHVRVFEFRDDAPGGGFADAGGFFAYDPNFRGGVTVTTCNPDGHSDEVVTAAGAGGGPHVRMFSLSGAEKPLSFMAYDPNFHGGVRVACGGAETRAF